ncbi:MAG: fibronectin type III domain-containing protein, partial [Actinomycetota bacterium]
MGTKTLVAFLLVVGAVVAPPSAGELAAADPPGPVRDLRGGFNGVDNLAVITFEFPTEDGLGIEGYDIKIDGDLVEESYFDPVFSGRIYRYPMERGEAFFVEVRAVGDGGVRGPWSSTTIYGAGAPSLPVISDVTAASGSVSVRWQPADGAGIPIDGYDVRIGDQRTFVDGDVLRWEAGGFSAGESVTVKVRSRNAVAWSWFARETITVPEPVPAPGPVEDLRARHVGFGVVVVEWDPPSTGGEVVSYAVRTSSDGIERTQETRLVELVMAAGQSQEVRVIAVGPDRRSVDSTIVATAGEAPGRPSVTTRAGSAGEIEVLWGEVDDDGHPIEAFEVVVAGRRMVVGADERRVVIGDLRPGELVNVTVRARNAVGWGERAQLQAAVGAELPVDDPPVVDPPVVDPPVGDPPVGDPPVDDEPVDGPPVDRVPPAAVEPGYWMAERTGALYGFGVAEGFDGVGSRVVSVATDASGSGLWVVRADGVVETRGAAVHFGDVDLTV